MTVRAVEGKKPYTGGKGIEIDENKVISLRLRDENNLIIWDEGDNEIYVDLQLDDEIRPTDAFPVGITTGRVIIDNGWDKTGTLICAKTTSGDNIKIFYSDDGHLYVDHGTGLFTQVYLKPEVDALLSDLRTYVDTELAKKQDKLIAGDNIEIAQDGKTISAILPPLNRFLSLWNCSTGMPISFPTAPLPFEYEAGDHFLVETVDPTTNYRPSGTEYDGTASQTVETAEVAVGDVYIYDGTTWLLQINHDKTVSFAQIAGQPSDNQALAQALNSKQNTLTAGQNITINQNNEISATDTTYNAGNGIEILDIQDYSAMQGPCPDGFHIPLTTEWQSVYNIWTSLGGGSSDGPNFGIALKLPLSGGREAWSANVNLQGTQVFYWSSSRFDSNTAYVLYFQQFGINPQDYTLCTFGFHVRCFKDTPVIPTSSWTKLYGTSIESGGIFWSSADGLISLSSDGQNWITISDKNLGATQVWNNGDTLSEANCGKYYQWGNNYGFPFTGSVTTSSTKVDASGYGPGNYYNSSTFITGYEDRSSVQNDNLWGGETGVVTLNNVITNTGVLSVNGQTGDVTIQTGGTYTAGDGINIDANDEISNTLPGAIIASTAPSNPVQGNLWYDTTNDKLMSYDGTNWNECGGGTVTLEAGTGISITAASAHKDNQGPCPDGFHIPTPAEWQDVIDLGITESAWGSSNNSSDISNYLKLPLTGRIRNTGVTNSDTYYWSCQVDGADYGHDLDLTSSTASASDRSYKANAFPIRAFADTPVIPDSSWTIIVHGAGADDGIFWNQSLGLITITDGTDAITIMDKNLGATTVWSYGETVTADKAGKLYQWGNNHGFDWNTTPSTTSSSRVSASAYGPGNYYDKSTFIIYAGSWDLSNNGNLWGGVTLGTWGESGYRITALNNGDVVGPSSAIDGHLAVFDGATGKIIKDGGILNDVKVSATAPSSPTEGMVWYDTTNDELKIYDGSAWNAVGGGGGGDVRVSIQANNVFTPGMKIWGGTSANYANLTPDGNTAYLII